MPPDTETHTIDEALERFTLVTGAGSPDDNTACVMTALSWVAGESWSDHPACAHPILANLAIRANDHGGTTAEQRADIVRAGATGLIETWWLPGEVVVACIAEGMSAAELPVERCLATLAAVTAWKDAKVRPDLRGADLRDADLRDADLSVANLRYANLRYANLRGADLRGADLRGADLRDADLSVANLRYANLRYANLRYADLWDADLRGADLRDADLRDADLRDANLRGADLRGAYGVGLALCNQFTVPPAGWTVNTSTWRMEQTEVPA